MKKKASIQSKLLAFKRFITINIWVQKLRLSVFRWWAIVDIFERLLSSMSPLINTLITGYALNAIQLGIQNNSLHVETLYPYLLYYFFNNLISRVFYSLFHLFDWYASVFDMDRRIDESVITKLNQINWEHIESAKMEKRIQMTYNRASYNIRRLGRLHLDFIVIGISLVFALIAAKINPIILLVIVVKELPSIITSAKLAKKTHALNDSLHNDWTIKGNIVHYFRNFNSLLEIKVSNVFAPLHKIFRKTNDHVRNSYLQKDKPYIIPNVLIGIFEVCINTGITGYYAYQLVIGNMLIGTFQYTTGLISQIGDQIYNLLVNVNSAVDSYRYIIYAYELLNFENVNKDGSRQIEGQHFDIEFKNVWFRYPKTKKYALKNINLKIEDNARLALVGENGAGKSTFLKLLMCLYYPTKGQILINGIPHTEYSKQSLYKNLAVVTQDFNRYAVLSAKQNIALYDHGLDENKMKIIEAAKLATADDFIAKLPNKYDTILTKMIEGGVELSTGQWQRIAVARQFYANRPFVILDEPTSAIDPIAEGKIFTNLYHHVKDKTVIVVSHRYNTVRAAKKILVFKDGEIIEQGTHDELIAQRGYYENAYDVQNQEKKL